MKTIETALMIFLLALLSCSRQEILDSELAKKTGDQGIAPVLNEIVFAGFDSGSIVINQPTFSVQGIPAPAVEAYIGVDGSISIDGSAVSGAVSGPLDVTAGGHTFSGLSASTSYRVILVAKNSKGYSVKQAVQSTGTAIPRDGLAGEWLFEGSANDTSGNAKHGSVTGAVPAADRFGNAGKAYSFDGDDHIQLPASNSIISDTSSSYTISAWFKVASVVNYPVILSAYNYNGSENTYFAHCYVYPFLNKNKIYNGLRNTSTYTYISENYDSISDGLWHHVLLITDNSSLKHQMYIDNYLVYETSISKQNYIDDGVLRVGASYYNDLYNYFYGFIDDIRIYNRVLNVGEISALYQENIWGKKVLKPVFSISGGMYSGSPDVSLTSATTDAEIYYTTDGSEPSKSSKLYISPISIPALSTTTLKAKAYKSGYIDSFPETNIYTTVSGYVLQPGYENGEDTTIGSVYDRDYSTGNLFKNGGWSDEYDALVRFDVSAAPSSPTSAKLYLYSVDNTSTVCTMYLEKITSTWDESSVRWTSRPSFSNIATIPAPTKGQWYIIDITSLYNDWKSSPSTNYGLMLRPTSTSNTLNSFYSSNLMDDTSLRPYLLVE